MTMENVLFILKALVAGSIFFVWVVRYKNLVEEFKNYHYPDWLRDLVGILKLSFTLMLFLDSPQVNTFGAAGISMLMLAALLTHLRVKNPVQKMLPSATLMGLSFIILCFSYPIF